VNPQKEPLADGNIQLDYRLRVYFNQMETVLFADGAEVFVDEHGVQWIKFYAKNGPAQDKQHIMRTENIVIVKES
jgi:hypothetical protein